MKIENLNGYANQFIIKPFNPNYKEIIFQSYDSEIASFKEWFDLGADYNPELENPPIKIKKLYLINDVWDYSVTTRRHFKTFINQYTPFRYENKAQWLKEIKQNDKIKVL